MALHVAVLLPVFRPLILDGRKTIESRFSVQRRVPFGAVAPGERIYFKASSGGFFAAATADRVWMTDRLTPAMAADLRRKYNPAIHGDAAYWQAKRDCRYATLIWLRQVTATSTGPRYRPQHMRAWYTLDDSADTLPPSAAEQSPIEIVMTDGAIRNRYVRLGREAAAKLKGADGSFVLRLADGPEVRTDLHRGIFRWRGWGRWFDSQSVRGGDRLRLTPGGPGQYDVALVRP
jgi:hypothetical protein